MECVGITHEDEQGIVEQATDSIQEMLSERGSILRLVPFISDILEKLASYIPQTLCISFFDAINEILKIYSPTLKKTPAIIGVFVSNLVERARLEYEVVRKSKGTPKLVLTKIWNIINGIGENKDFIPEFQEGIEKEMLPLFSFLETDDDLPFDDDILRYVNSTIKLSNKISPVIWNIFKLYPKIFDQRLSLVTPLFPSLNQIIVHGKDEIEGNSETIHTLVEMGIRGINTPHPDAGKSGPAMAALHFQILIQYVGIPNEEMERMLHACLAKLNVTEKLKGFLKVRYKKYSDIVC